MVRFPYAVFIRFFVAQLVVFSALFVACVLIFIQAGSVEPSLFWPLCGTFFFGSVFVSLVTSWRFTRPIRRALQKAFRIASKRYAKITGEAEDVDLFDDEPGEYSELVSALDRIDKKLKKRKDQLLREREENAAFMGSVQEALLSINPEGRLRYFNSQFGALFLSPDFVRTDENVTLPEVIRVPEIVEAFHRVVLTGGTQKVQVRMNTRIDNQPRDFTISLAPLRKEKSGEIRGVIGVFHDVTDLRKTERIRIEFVANASHELRTPLTSIKGYLDTFKEDFAAGHYESGAPFLETISRNVDRLIELVNDLLTLSALEHHSELQLETINALALSDHVSKDLAFMAAEKNQMIRVIGEVPPFLGDLRKVEQVLRNLVSNAIKYIPEGKQIQIRWETSPRGEILLRVIDNGPGIPEEHHQRLFERFYRIDKGRSRDAGGTGLGLAIVKHIMQSHGGSVTVKSQPGVGSEFICTFPALRGAQSLHV